MDKTSDIFSGFYPGLGSIIFGTPVALLYASFFVILYFSSSSKAKSILIFHRLMHERRVIFIVLLLGILFYIDNIYRYWTAGGVLFPIFIMLLISI